MPPTGKPPCMAGPREMLHTAESGRVCAAVSGSSVSRRFARYALAVAKLWVPDEVQFSSRPFPTVPVGAGPALIAGSAAAYRGRVHCGHVAPVHPGRPRARPNRSRWQVRPSPLGHQVGGAPAGPVPVVARPVKQVRPPRALLMRAVGHLGPPQRAGQAAADAKAVPAASARPGSRVVTSWTSQVLPSGSVKEQRDP